MASAAPTTTAGATSGAWDAASALGSTTASGTTASSGPRMSQNTTTIAALLPTGVSNPPNRSGMNRGRKTFTSAPVTSTGTVTASRAISPGLPVATATAATGTPATTNRTRHGTIACHQASDSNRNGRAAERRGGPAARPAASPQPGGGQGR